MMIHIEQRGDYTVVVSHHRPEELGAEHHVVRVDVTSASGLQCVRFVGDLARIKAILDLAAETISGGHAELSTLLTSADTSQEPF